jgi:transposase
VASISRRVPIHLGLDVHKDTISVGILAADQQVPDVERITHDEASIRRLVGRLGNPRMLRACDQHRPDRLRAGPAAAQHGRRLRRDRPVADPQGAGRQGPRPTGATAGGSPRLHRAGELVAIRIPTVQEEAVRDLCRTRADMVHGLTRARNRLGKFLLRHGRVWRGGATWTLKHQAWLGSQRFDQPAMAQTFGHDLAVVEVRNTQLDAVEADLAGWCDRAPLDWQVARLAAYRGVTRLGALTLAAQGRPAGAGSPPHTSSWGFAGWSQASCSSGASVHRGRLTKAGNAHLRAQLARVGLGLEAPPRRWCADRPPPAGPATGGRRAGVGRPAAPVRSVPGAGRPQERQAHRGGRDRPPSSPGSCGRRCPPDPPHRTVTCSPPSRDRPRRCAHSYDAPGRRRLRTDPREPYAVACARRP